MNLFDDEVFLRSAKERKAAWTKLQKRSEFYWNSIEEIPVKKKIDYKKVKSFLDAGLFENVLPLEKAVDEVFDQLIEHQTHFSNPNYFGLFDPASHPMGVMAESLMALFNLQLASLMQSHFAIELEKKMLVELAKQMGLSRMKGHHFTNGGNEANLTAVLLALTQHFPKFARDGIFSIKHRCSIYVSEESHHTVQKAARIVGLGENSVRVIAVTSLMQWDFERLEKTIRLDLKNGRHPLMIVGTVGTTKAGMIDDISEVQRFAKKYGMWFHVDGAWGGASRLVPTFQKWSKASELADSWTVDAHKWLSVPLTAGIFMTKYPDLLRKIFYVEAGYLPRGREKRLDPFRETFQWSRRFIGLKFYMTLRTVGWNGYRQMIESRVKLGRQMRENIQGAGFTVFNSTELPVLCFSPSSKGMSEMEAQKACRKILEKAGAWVSVVKLPKAMKHRYALRAAVVNFRTKEQHIEKLSKFVTVHLTK